MKKNKDSFDRDWNEFRSKCGQRETERQDARPPSFPPSHLPPSSTRAPAKFCLAGLLVSVTWKSSNVPLLPPPKTDSPIRVIILDRWVILMTETALFQPKTANCQPQILACLWSIEPRFARLTYQVLVLGLYLGSTILATYRASSDNYAIETPTPMIS